MQGWLAAEPLVIERGEGCWLVDVDGRRYIDGVSSLWVNVHGHTVPEIDEAVSAQLGRIAHSTLLGLANVASIELAAELVALAPPGLEKVFYSEAGACAVEVALKMAFGYWRHRGVATKRSFLSLENGYHGDTLGAVSVGGIDLFHAAYRTLLFPTFTSPSPYCYRCPLGRTYPACDIACLGPLEATLDAHAGEVCAVIVEPLVQAAGGMITAPPGYLRRLADLCDAHDVLLIADEVATGVGRTGTFFACEQEGVTPDILVAGKGLTGGYLPLAVTMTTRRVFDAFLGEPEEGKTFFHGHTYTGNPLACAAALANLRLFEQEETLERLQPKIELLTALLEPIATLAAVREVRQRGFMVGIELGGFPVEARMGHQVTLEARRRGAIVRPLGDVLVLMPPLAIETRQLRKLVGIVGEAIEAATSSRALRAAA